MRLTEHVDIAYVVPTEKPENEGGMHGLSEGGLRSRLRDRQPVVATFLMIPSVEMVEMLASAGFDAVVIDLEHAAIETADLVPLAAAARGAGIASIARLSHGHPSMIGKALDCGVDGVMVPHISSRKDAERAVTAARFPPEGDRSLNPYTRGNHYGSWPEGSLAALNLRSAVIGMVEGPAAVEHLDAILDVDGLDAVFVGPVDLSGAMGVPGQPDHPHVVAEMEKIFQRVAESGRAGGLYVHNPKRAAHWLHKGAILLAVSADIAMAFAGLDAGRRQIDEGEE